MKIDRLIGILSVLLQQDKVTAPYLAEKFEVSRRTINRDIEDICKAGIPIVTTQGKHGGIAIMEGYRMDKTLLTSFDMQTILAGIRSLDSVSGTNKYQKLMEKLSMGNAEVLASNHHIMIDLSSWYKSTLAPKIELIQQAIDLKKYVTFTYYAPAGESQRKVEPYLLVFQWASWYMWGYCVEKADYRLFKLNRMQECHSSTEVFEERETPPFQARENYPGNELGITALFQPEMKWRLIDEYGPDSFVQQTDGQLLFSFEFADKRNLFGWLMSFGNQVSLQTPAELREEFKKVLQETLKQYQ